MNFYELLQFVEREMRMLHVYQPVMLRELLSRNGRVAIAEIARALLNEDRSQIEVLLRDHKEDGRTRAEARRH